MPTIGKVLVANTDHAFGRRLCERLLRAGVEQRACSSFSEISSVLADWAFDVALLDDDLPPEGGIEVCRWLRAGGHRCTVIVCSDRNDPFDRVVAYETGADGFFCKQDELIVLEAQLRRALRARHSCSRCVEGVAAARDSCIRDLGHATGEDPAPLDFRHLTRMEERLLAALHRSPGALIPTTALVRQVWGRDQLQTKNLYDLVSVLREKLKPEGWTIVNHRRRGYRLERRGTASRSVSGAGTGS